MRAQIPSLHIPTAPLTPSDMRVPWFPPLTGPREHLPLRTRPVRPGLRGEEREAVRPADSEQTPKGMWGRVNQRTHELRSTKLPEETRSQTGLSPTLFSLQGSRKMDPKIRDNTYFPNFHFQSACFCLSILSSQQDQYSQRE